MVSRISCPVSNCISHGFCNQLTYTDTHDNVVETWPITGKLLYDWSIRKQCIDHGAGAYECKHFYNTDKACLLIFNHDGMYRLIDGDNVPCCLDLPGVGTPPPDWAQQANGTFNSIQFDQLSGLFAFQWTFDHLPPPPAVTLLIPMNHSFHTVREVAFGKYSGRPLAFTFPGKAEGRQYYHFDVKSMHVGPQKNSSAIFDIPNDCINRPCQAASMLSGA